MVTRQPTQAQYVGEHAAFFDFLGEQLARVGVELLVRPAHALLLRAPVLFDLDREHNDGLALLRGLCATQRALPIIAIANEGTLELAAELQRFGVDAFHLKSSASIETILHTLRAARQRIDDWDRALAEARVLSCEMSDCLADLPAEIQT